MSYLAECSPQEAIQTLRVAQEAKDLRQSHRLHKQGFSNDKGRTMRSIGRIPMWVIFHPEYSKYFDKNQDPHERKKSIIKFLRDHPEFCTVDKI